MKEHFMSISLYFNQNESVGKMVNEKALNQVETVSGTAHLMCSPFVVSWCQIFLKYF